ncbi:MAG: tRNA (guanine(46)-N(7))-methyltransferase TrmB [Dermatophilaceae bacterium]
MTSAAMVRTYHARHGRRSALTEDRLSRLLPRYAVAPGLLEASASLGAPVVLDVGCGHGAAAIAFAEAYPGHHVVAVDVHPPGVARMLAAAQERGILNLSAHLGDAVELLTWRTGCGALAAVHLFFPDPWPKTRHRRRRFVTGARLDLLASRLAPGGHVLLATDHDEYAAYVVREVRDHGAFTVRPVTRPAWRPVSGYEAKGLQAGRRITELRLDRADVAVTSPAR